MISTETLILIAVILVMIDIFFVSDITTHIAYIIIAYVIAHVLPVPFLYQIIAGIVAWFGLVTFHYLLWRKVLQKIANEYIAPTRHKSGMDNLIGKKGIIKEVEGKKFVSVHEELYPYETINPTQPEIGEEVTIIETQSDKVIIY